MKPDAGGQLSPAFLNWMWAALHRFWRDERSGVPLFDKPMTMENENDSEQRTD